MEKIKKYVYSGILIASVLIAGGGTVWKYLSNSAGGIKITGPESATVGQLCVFKIDGVDSADWTITPAGAEFYKDSGTDAVAVSSTIEGDFTVVAAILTDGKPSIVQTSIRFGPATDKRKREKKEVEPIANLEAWIETHTPDAPDAEISEVAAIFDDVTDSIARGVLTTVDGGLAKIRQKTALGPAGSDWETFFDGLSERIEAENPATAAEFGALSKRISDALKKCQRLHPEKPLTPVSAAPTPIKESSEKPKPSEKVAVKPPAAEPKTPTKVRVLQTYTSCPGGYCNAQ